MDVNNPMEHVNSVDIDDQEAEDNAAADVEDNNRSPTESSNQESHERENVTPLNNDDQNLFVPGPPLGPWARIRINRRNDIRVVSTYDVDITDYIRWDDFDMVIVPDQPRRPRRYTTMGPRDPVNPSAFLDNLRAARGPVPALRISPEPEDGPDGAAPLSLAELDNCSVLFRSRNEYDPPMQQSMANWVRRMQNRRTRVNCALLRLDVGLGIPDENDLGLIIRDVLREMGVPISDSE